MISPANSANLARRIVSGHKEYVMWINCPFWCSKIVIISAKVIVSELWKKLCKADQRRRWHHKHLQDQGEDYDSIEIMHRCDELMILRNLWRTATVCISVPLLDLVRWHKAQWELRATTTKYTCMMLVCRNSDIHADMLHKKAVTSSWYRLRPANVYAQSKSYCNPLMVKQSLEKRISECWQYLIAAIQE